MNSGEIQSLAQGTTGVFALGATAPHRKLNVREAAFRSGTCKGLDLSCPNIQL